MCNISYISNVCHTPTETVRGIYAQGVIWAMKINRYQARLNECLHNYLMFCNINKQLGFKKLF